MSIIPREPSLRDGDGYCSSSLSEKARQGLPLDDILVIDAHCHMGPTYNVFACDPTPSGVVASMNLHGIDKAVISYTGAMGSDYVQGNDRVIAAVRDYPDRYIGYCVINPHYPDEIPAELERCFAHDAMRGIKLHAAWHKCPLSDKRYRPALEFAAQKNLFVLMHTWSSEEVETAAQYAEEYPGITMIMGHTGGPNMERAADLISRHENLYGDFVLSASTEGNVEWLVGKVGAKKLLFGSDMPFISASHILSRIAMARISDAEKRDILGLNMQRIFDR